MQVLFWLARHGETTDSGKEIFRGQHDAKLDKNGFIEAYKQKAFFAKQDWHYLFCSPLSRAVQTGTIICEDMDESPILHPGLKPWNIGYLTGKNRKKYAKEMDYFIDHPDKVPEDGESLNQFQEGRIYPLLAEAMEIGLEQGKPCVLIAHSSIIHVCSHLLYGEHHHKDTSVEPGEIVEVYYDKGEFFARAIIKRGKYYSDFAAGKARS